MQTLRPKPNSPCHHCEDRWVDGVKTCHSTCERYATFLKDNEEYKKELAIYKSTQPHKEWYQTYTGWWRRQS